MTSRRRVDNIKPALPSGLLRALKPHASATSSERMKRPRHTLWPRMACSGPTNCRPTNSIATGTRNPANAIQTLAFAKPEESVAKSASPRGFIADCMALRVPRRRPVFLGEEQVAVADVWDPDDEQLSSKGLRPGSSGRLKGLNAVNVDQGNMCETISVRIENGNASLSDGNELRVPYLIGLTI
jgi:hypothetical protein